jgi:hypothetical protein
MSSLANYLASDGFASEGEFYDWLDQNRMSLRRPDPVLNLPVKPPPMPETYRGRRTGHNYPVFAPPANENFVFVGNRDDFSGNWYRKGDKIDPTKVGRTTFGHFGQDGVFGDQHHNKNLPAETFLSREDLQQKLQSYNLPFEGERSDLFKRFINVQEGGLIPKIADGEPLTEVEIADIVNRHEPINLQQAARLRELRGNQRNPSQINQPPQENSSWWQNSNLNPSSWRSQNNPMRLDGTQVSNAEANSLRQWGQQNLENQANNASMLNRLGTGSNPMTVNNLGAKSLASTGEAALGAEGAAAGGATFAARAMPMISLALMAGSLLQNQRASQQMKQDQEQQKSMRT